MSSITLRRYGVTEVVAYAAKAALDTIEWTADPHVPHGDLAAAREAGDRTRDAGLAVAGYGSYYRCGEPGSSPPFEQVLETAVAMKAPSVRVWAGRKGSAEAPASYWKTVERDLARVAELGTLAGCPVMVEHQDHTLNDCPAAWTRLVEGCGVKNLSSYWQPTAACEDRQRLDVVNEMLRAMGSVHVFVWEHGVRLPLSRGAREWLRIVEVLAADTRRDHDLLLQLVEKDRLEHFVRDAETLRDLVQQVG